MYDPAYGALSPVTSRYWSGGEPMYSYDPEKAKALLDEAGWKDANGDGIWETGGQPLRLDFPTHSGNMRFRDPAPIMQDELAEVGIDVNVLPQAPPPWTATGKAGNLRIGIMQWTLRDPELSLNAIFNSKNSNSFAWNRHKNSHMDGLLGEGLETADPGKRRVIYEEVQKLIVDDAMIKPLHLWSGVWGTRTEAKGLKVY